MFLRKRRSQQNKRLRCHFSVNKRRIRRLISHERVCIYLYTHMLNIREPLLKFVTIRINILTIIIPLHIYHFPTAMLVYHLPL